jgi:hypothetical protein
VHQDSRNGRRIVALGPGTEWPGQGLRASTPRKDFGLPRHGFRCTIIVASLAAAYAPRRPTETALYGLVQQHLASFLRHTAKSYDKPLPAYVEREFRAYLRCGVFAHGFVRAHCDDCGHDLLVPFSCKHRGICPSCAGRRMANTGAHLVDRVLPDVPLRQYVLSLPHELRMLAALKPAVLGALARMFVEAIFGMVQRRARRAGHVRPQCGAVTFVQRFGGSLNLNVHFHVVLMDGVFTRDDGARVHFHEAEAPSEEELLALAARTYTTAARWLRRHGHLADSTREDASTTEDVALEALHGCARIAMQRGSFAKAMAEGHDDAASREHRLPRAKSRFVAECEGFNVHAAVHIQRGDDLGRERLCRYGARPAMALGRLRVLRSGVVAYRVKGVTGAGATRSARVKHRVMTPLEFLARLAALIPPPRRPLVRFHGVIAPRSSWRRDVVPQPRFSEHGGCDQRVSKPPRRTKPTEGAHRLHATPVQTAAVQLLENAAPALVLSGAHATLLAPNVLAVRHWNRLLAGKLLAQSPRIDWATLLHRTFDIDVRVCGLCGGSLRVLALITDSGTASRILGALGLATQAPPLARARDPDDDWDASPEQDEAF